MPSMEPLPFNPNSKYPDVDRDMFGLAWNYLRADYPDRADVFNAMQARADELVRLNGYVSRVHYEQQMFNTLGEAVEAAEEYEANRNRH